MKKLSLGMALALILVLVVGAFAVEAAPPMPTPVPTPFLRPSFTDGRINAYDPGAPVAVFETRESVPIVNDNGVPTTADVVNGVQLLFWDGASAKEVMNVSAADIKAAIDKITPATASKNTSTTTNNSTLTNNTSNLNTTPVTSNANSVMISKENGYTLNYSKDGFLWISTPPDFEGKVYTFSWQKDF
jgi:hypothetical protein